jgi:meso-butanediol dehydrogenase/(S,S)-butanediol dehydrogenase/diacetyl reductase
MSKNNRVALITGAGMGIGKAIAERLARDGFQVAINDISEETAQATVKELEAAGATAFAVQADVSNREQAHAMVDSVVEHFGRLDVLVANAGIVQVDPIMSITEADFDKLFSINVKGVIWCAQAAAKHMIAQGGGKIINAGSDASHTSNPMLGTYAASKFSVRVLTQTMAREFAPHGITVNAYCPGIVDTGMWDTIDSRASEVMGIPRGAMLEEIKSKIILGRMQTPDDVANFVSFLASEDADYITGQSMITDGGVVMI